MEWRIGIVTRGPRINPTPKPRMAFFGSFPLPSFRLRTLKQLDYLIKHETRKTYIDPNVARPPFIRNTSEIRSKIQTNVIRSNVDRTNDLSRLFAKFLI